MEHCFILELHYILLLYNFELSNAYILEEISKVELQFKLPPFWNGCRLLKYPHSLITIVKIKKICYCLKKLRLFLFVRFHDVRINVKAYFGVLLQKSKGNRPKTDLAGVFFSKKWIIFRLKLQLKQTVPIMNKIGWDMWPLMYEHINR